MSYTEAQYRELVRRQTKPGVPVSAPKKRSKHGNKKTIMGGMVFHSGHEARRYRDLQLMQQAGQIRNLQRQVPYDFVVNGQHICTYLADAVYERPSDHPWTYWETVVEDCKNPKTRTLPEYRIKVKLMAACHGITIQEIL